MTWWDPLHQRAFVVKKVCRDEADNLGFLDDIGRRFRLRPMTLEIYRRVVLPEIPGGRDFETPEELEHFFTQTVWGR